MPIRLQPYSSQARPRLSKSEHRFRRVGRGTAPAVLIVLAGFLAACMPQPPIETSLRSEPRKRVVSKPASSRTAPKVPLPEAALLRPPMAPTGCESHTTPQPLTKPSTGLRQGEFIPSQGKQDEHLANAIRMEYERECYKQSEARVREQLIKLQASVRQTIGVAKRGPSER